MDKIDIALLRGLTNDARTSVSTLAKRLEIARTTVQARIAKMESRGVIAGYTVKLGEATRANRIRATVLIQFEPRTGPAIIQRLNSMVEVEVAHTSSGRFDLVLQVATPNTARLDEVLDVIGAIKGVLSSESLIHLSTKIDRAI
ncbi:MAG: Lrp/AsnC family transcriptional regulator [Paracoccaceae bacterium]